MHEHEHQRVIDELQTVIDGTQSTLSQAEAHGLDATLPKDYAHLLDILDRAIKQQREHTRALLAKSPEEHSIRPTLPQLGRQ